MLRFVSAVIAVSLVGVGTLGCGSSSNTGGGGASASTSSGSGGGGTGGAGTSFTLGEFDPVAHVDEAFAAAAKVPNATDLAVLRIQGTPVASATDYAAVHFTWAFSFAANVEGAASVITTKYPGWKTSTEKGLGIGAALAEKDVPKTIAIDGEKLLDALAAAKVTASTCPLMGKDALQLRGNLTPMGTIWFWDLYCGASGDVDIDAATGKKLSP